MSTHKLVVRHDPAARTWPWTAACTCGWRGTWVEQRDDAVYQFGQHERGRWAR